MRILGAKSPGLNRDDGSLPSFVELQRDMSATRSISISGFLLGLVLIAVMWKSYRSAAEALNIIFWALACYASGALLGFLFGIPRVFQKAPEFGAAEAKKDIGGLRSPSPYALMVNTNLDDVSDWLTKIVIGVGLVELEKIPGAVHRLAIMAAGDGRGNLAPLIVAVMIYFTVVGFISGYLTTRMFFQRAFRIADLAASGSSVREVIERQVVNTREVVAPPG